MRLPTAFEKDETGGSAFREDVCVRLVRGGVATEGTRLREPAAGAVRVVACLRVFAVNRVVGRRGRSGGRGTRSLWAALDPSLQGEGRVRQVQRGVLLILLVHLHASEAVQLHRVACAVHDGERRPGHQLHAAVDLDVHLHVVGPRGLGHVRHAVHALLHRHRAHLQHLVGSAQARHDVRIRARDHAPVRVARGDVEGGHRRLARGGILHRHRAHGGHHRSRRNLHLPHILVRQAHPVLHRHRHAEVVDATRGPREAHRGRAVVGGKELHAERGRASVPEGEVHIRHG
mmetsp:Transcript_25547/g.48333  ORF Transcript_25547/g.48333 Transcript_25547/m.48333 type:complete len:288 (+) Transcript_25547:3556-4419(+)